MTARPAPLIKAHDLSRFDCGKQPLTDWLKKYAVQSDASGHTKTFVLTDEDGVAVIGYFSFSVISVEHEETTPARVKKGLARYSIPVFLIARLAIDSRFRGQGLGGRLLLFALKRAAIAAARSVPIRAVVVDAIDDEAKSFYSKFDFEPWPIDGMRMWLLMKDLMATLKTKDFG